MNWKIVILGGFGFFLAQQLVGLVTGMVIHEGVLEEAYIATSTFWRPELTQTPPDMVALLPRWLSTALVASFITAGIYSAIRSVFNGTGLIKGLKFGVVLILITGCFSAGLSGVFNLPTKIWLWWFIESVAYFLIGGAALGFIAQKVTAE